MEYPTPSGRGGQLDSLLLDYPTAAARLGTSERHLRELWARREIGAVKLGKLVRFRPEDLESYVQKHLVPPAR